MSVAVIAPPAPFVSLELAKSHLRVDQTDDDALIDLQLAAACGSIDGPAGWLGRALGTQTLELRQDSFDPAWWRFGVGFAWSGGWDWASWPFSRIALPFPPFQSVESITFEDGLGADQVLTPMGWTATDEGVEPAFGMSWPSGRVAANAVRIRYVAGYAEDQVPAPIQAAVLLMIGDMYGNRESQLIGTRAAVAENPTLASLLNPYRIYG